MKAIKIIIGVVIAVAVVLVGFSAYIVGSGLTSAKHMREDRDSAVNKLEGLHRENPFPSQENIDKETATLAQLKAWHDRLLAEMKKGGVDTSDITSTISFNSRREAVLRELRESGVTDAGTRIVPPDYNFGFDRYKDGDLPNKNDVPRLGRQLYMMQALVKEFYAAKIDRITACSRVEFEGQDTEDEFSQFSCKRSMNGVDFDCQSFTFEIDGREASLVELLNRIGAMPMFAVVTKVDVSKRGPDFAMPPSREEAERNARGGEPSRISFGDQPEEDPAAKAVNARPPSRRSRLVSGRNREAPLHAVISIDVFTFGDRPEDKE